MFTRKHVVFLLFHFICFVGRAYHVLLRTRRDSLGTRRCCDVESTSLTLIQRRNNVVCPGGRLHYECRTDKPSKLWPDLNTDMLAQYWKTVVCPALPIFSQCVMFAGCRITHDLFTLQLYIIIYSDCLVFEAQIITVIR